MVARLLSLSLLLMLAEPLFAGPSAKSFAKSRAKMAQAVNEAASDTSAEAQAKVADAEQELPGTDIVAGSSAQNEPPTDKVATQGNKVEAGSVEGGPEVVVPAVAVTEVVASELEATELAPEDTVAVEAASADEPESLAEEPKIAAAPEICPVVNCDCNAIALADWRERCLEAESLIKQACVENDGVPQHYCSLHGPEATPLAIETQLPAVPPTTLSKLRFHKRQLVMLMWSVKDDLDNVQMREEEGAFGDAVQVHKLLNRNVDRMFKTQVRAAEGERQRAGDDEAEDIWQDYRDDLGDLVENFEKYGDLLWQKMEAANDAQLQKAYRVLSMRVYRTGSKISEHAAIAEGLSGADQRAARAWQYSARFSQKTLEKEIATTNKAKRVNYYRAQSAARWNRASYYWGHADKQAQVAETAGTAERLLTAQ